jgi:hypothetical protein
LFILVIVSIVKVVGREKSYNTAFAAVCGVWVGYQIQSVISINQIGIGVWGWALSGLIIGYEINTRNVVVIEPIKKKGHSVDVPVQASAGTVVAMFVAFALGISVSAPPYLASVRLKSALQTGNPQKVQDAAYIWPADPTRFAQVASILSENKLDAQALKVAADATEKFPDSYLVWNTLSKMNSATPDQKAEALAQMKRLDPLNPDLK